MTNGDQPATKQDVVDAVKASEERVIETMRDIQTELLKGFYNYAHSADERMASNEGEASSVKKRLAILESRMTEVERRLITPPPPAA